MLHRSIILLVLVGLSVAMELQKTIYRSFPWIDNWQVTVL